MGAVFGVLSEYRSPGAMITICQLPAHLTGLRLCRSELIGEHCNFPADIEMFEWLQISVLFIKVRLEESVEFKEALLSRLLPQLPLLATRCIDSIISTQSHPGNGMKVRSADTSRLQAFNHHLRSFLAHAVIRLIISFVAQVLPSSLQYCGLFACIENLEVLQTPCVHLFTSIVTFMCSYVTTASHDRRAIKLRLAFVPTGALPLRTIISLSQFVGVGSAPHPRVWMKALVRHRGMTVPCRGWCLTSCGAFWIPRTHSASAPCAALKSTSVHGAPRPGYLTADSLPLPAISANWIITRANAH